MRPLFSTFAISIFFLSTALAQKQSGDKVLIKDLPQLIREKNEKVQASELMVSASKKRTGFLVRSFMPEVSLRAGNHTAKLGQNTTENREYWSADAQLNLYRGNRDSIEDKIRESKTLMAKAEYYRDYQMELRDAKKTYWQIVANQKIFSELQETISFNMENIKSSRRRSSAGVTTNSDTIQFELEHITLTQNLKKLSIEQDLLKNKLAVAIGYSNHESLLLENDFPYPLKTIDSNLTSDSPTPDTEILRAEELLHNLKRDKASNWWIPSVDAFATYRRPTFLESDTRALANQNEFIAGIQFSMSFGAGLEDIANKSAENLEAKAAAKRLSYSILTAKAEKHEMNEDLNLLRSLIYETDKDVEKSDSFLKLTRNEFTRGIKNGPDLQDAMAKLYSFRNRRIELYRLYYQTLADLEYQSARTITYDEQSSEEYKKHRDTL